MEIRAISPETIPLVNIVAARVNTTSTVSVPVDPDALLYARFKHISGVPATDGDQGVSIERLRILDSLIDRLVATNGQKAYVRDVRGMSPNEAETLISRYEQELHSALRASRPEPYRDSAAAGILLNLVA